VYKRLARKKFFLIPYAFVLALVICSAQAHAAPILFKDKISLSRGTKTTELNIGTSDKLLVTIKAPGHDVGVRAFFETFTDEVSWDNKAKIASIKNNGKELVIPVSGNYTPKENEVVLPDGWAYFKDGKIYLKFPYFAYVFDRYAEFDSSSEEYQWKEKLAFLGIEYVDSNDSTAKDGIIHTSVHIKA